jgi:hypothetical protein
VAAAESNGSLLLGMGARAPRLLPEFLIPGLSNWPFAALAALPANHGT